MIVKVLHILGYQASSDMMANSQPASSHPTTTVSSIFLRLPPEILSIIVDHLDLTDVKSLRSTNRYHRESFNPDFLRLILGQTRYLDLLGMVCKYCWSWENLVWQEGSTPTMYMHVDNDGRTACLSCALAEGYIVPWEPVYFVRGGEAKRNHPCLWCLSLHVGDESADCKKKYQRARMCYFVSQVIRSCISLVAYVLSVVFVPGDVRVIVSTVVSASACFVGSCLLTLASSHSASL